MSVELRYANFEDYPRISRFLAEHWSADNIYVRHPELFDWTFGRRELWDRDGYSFALAENGAEIVGILGGIPYEFNDRGEQSRAIWLSNFMIRADHRRGPLAVRLLQMMRREPYTATIAFGINPRTALIYQVMRWQVLADIPRHFVILPGAVNRAAELIQTAHTDWPIERARSLAENFALADSLEMAAEASNFLADDWDEAGWRYFSERTIGAARNQSYLRWRYLDHPIFTYRLIAIREEATPEFDGLLIWRLEEIRMVDQPAERSPERIGRVVEFLPVSADNARNLFAQLLVELKQADAIGADFYCYHGEIRAWLDQLGMKPVESHADGFQLPARFQPLDGKSPDITSSIFAPASIAAPSFNRDCAWYWTKSDADQDRPN